MLDLREKSALLVLPERTGVPDLPDLRVHVDSQELWDSQDPRVPTVNQARQERRDWLVAKD